MTFGAEEPPQLHIADVVGVWKFRGRSETPQRGAEPPLIREYDDWFLVNEAGRYVQFIITFPGLETRRPHRLHVSIEGSNTLCLWAGPDKKLSIQHTCHVNGAEMKLEQQKGGRVFICTRVLLADTPDWFQTLLAEEGRWLEEGIRKSL